MLISGNGCCNAGSTYDRYFIGVNKQIAAVVDNPDINIREHWETTHTYFLAKSAFKAKYPPSPTPSGDDVASIISRYNSRNNGNWEVEIAKDVSVGRNQPIVEYYFHPFQIPVYSDGTDEYAYTIATRYTNTRDATGIITAIKTETIIISVHTGKKLKIYEKVLDFQLGSLSIVGGSFIDGNFQYITNSILSDTYGSDSGRQDFYLHCWISYDKMYLSNLNTNTSPIVDIQDYHTLLTRTTPEFRRSYIYLEIDVISGEVLKEILNWADYNNLYQPLFDKDLLIQDITKVIGTKFYKGDPSSGVPHRTELVIGELTTETYNVPYLKNTTVLRTLQYGISNQYNNSQIRYYWGQDLTNTYSSFHHAEFADSTHNTNKVIWHTDVFKDDTVLEVRSFNTLTFPHINVYEFLEPSFLDGFILVSIVDDTDTTNTFTLYSKASNGSTRWTKSFPEYYYPGSFSQSGILNCNDSMVLMSYYPINFAQQILDDSLGLSHVETDSGYKYSDYYRWIDNSNNNLPDGQYCYLNYFNINLGFFEPVTVVIDPETPGSGYGSYDQDRVWTVFPEYEDLLVYRVGSIGGDIYTYGIPSARLNFIRQTGLPDYYFDTEGH